jgi:hypothetical protein
VNWRAGAEKLAQSHVKAISSFPRMANNYARHPYLKGPWRSSDLEVDAPFAPQLSFHPTLSPCRLRSL